MVPPKENSIAAFPPVVRVGNVTLGPLTLEGAIRLSERGIDTSLPIGIDDIFFTAFVLSGADDLKSFVRRAKCDLGDLSTAIERQLNTAFSTFVRPARESAGETASQTPKGLGWPLEFAEFLCHEYGWTFDVAMATPVSRVYALIACCRQRNGGRHAGLDYIERRYREEVAAGRIKPIRIFD